MRKKVFYMLALAILMLTTAGFGLWAGLAAERAAADESSQTQVAKPWIGVSLSNINSRLAERLGLPQNEGVVIVKAVSGSPAEQAGLQAKDILLKIGATSIDTVKTAVSTVSSYKVGDVVTLTILRNNQNLTVNVTLAVAPSPSFMPKLGMLLKGWPGLGLSGLNLPNLLKELNLDGIGQGQLLDHFKGAQISLTDKDGNPVTVQIVPGTVASVSGNTLVLTPSDTTKGPTVTFSVPDGTIIRKGTGAVALSALAGGDKAVVVTVNNQVKAVLAGQEVTIWPGMRLRQGMMGEFCVPQLRGGMGNMLGNMMRNWRGN